MQSGGRSKSKAPTLALSRRERGLKATAGLRNAIDQAPLPEGEGTKSNSRSSPRHGSSPPFPEGEGTKSNSRSSQRHKSSSLSPWERVGVRVLLAFVADPAVDQRVTHGTRQAMAQERAILAFGQPFLARHGRRRRVKQHQVRG